MKRKEELLQIIEQIQQQRESLYEKLSQINKLTYVEKEELYNSFRENFTLLVHLEKELNDLEFQEWCLFMEECSKELGKLKKQLQ